MNVNSKIHSFGQISCLIKLIVILTQPELYRMCISGIITTLCVEPDNDDELYYVRTKSGSWCVKWNYLMLNCDLSLTVLLFTMYSASWEQRSGAMETSFGNWVGYTAVERWSASCTYIHREILWTHQRWVSFSYAPWKNINGWVSEILAYILPIDALRVICS